MSKDSEEKKKNGQNCGHEHEHEHKQKDNCDCAHEHHHKDSCDCEHDDHHEHCHDEHCDCGCEDDEVVIEGFKDNKEFQKYEKAFIQLEDALIKADKELTEAKKLAEQNEHLAGAYKKDLERYKERAKEQENMFKQKAVENVADKLIPILDNFEQALKVGGDKNTIKGFEMIEAMLKNAVHSLGIEEIEALGKTFDPELHNAVGRKKTNDKKKANTVATVYQKGYRIVESGKVVRHSMVEIYYED